MVRGEGRLEVDFFERGLFYFLRFLLGQWAARFYRAEAFCCALAS